MRLRPKTCFLFCLLFLCGLRADAQSSSETTAKLFTRYESGASANRLYEDVLTLKLSAGSNDKARIGVRVCSKEPMPFALITASADPFLIAELLIERHAYSPARIIYLRSGDCLSSKKSAEPVTEVWVIPEGASLPSHVESATGSQVRRTSLGKEEVNRGVRDYRIALRKLIRDLQTKPTAVGVVFGFFLDHPSQALQRRLREVTRTLKRSGLPPNRYLVRPMGWNDEVSTYPPDKEPSYPCLFLVEITKPSQGAHPDGN
jgi:hypothetical protein